MSLGSFRGVGSSAGPQSDRLSAMKQAFSVSIADLSILSVCLYLIEFVHRSSLQCQSFALPQSVLHVCHS